MATHPAAWARRGEVFNATTGVAALEPICAAVFAPTPIAVLAAESNAINTIGNAVAGPPALAAIPAADVPTCVRESRTHENYPSIPIDTCWQHVSMGMDG